MSLEGVCSMTTWTGSTRGWSVTNSAIIILSSCTDCVSVWILCGKWFILDSTVCGCFFGETLSGITALQSFSYSDTFCSSHCAIGNRAVKRTRVLNMSIFCSVTTCSSLGCKCSCSSSGICLDQLCTSGSSIFLSLYQTGCWIRACLATDAQIRSRQF